MMRPLASALTSVAAISLALGAMLSATGCFYTEQINERPSAEIIRLASSELHRAGHLDVAAVIADPDDDSVTLAWTARACAPGGLDCDSAPLAESTLDAFRIDIPQTRISGEPVAVVRVELQVTDVHGAVAKPSQVLLVDVPNSAPTVALQSRSLDDDGGNPVGLPTWFAAEVSDADDGASGVTLSWSVDTPSGAGAYTFVDAGDSSSDDDTVRDESRRLITSTPGTYTVNVTATDVLGAVARASLGIAVLSDRAPCLGVLNPVPPPDDAIAIFDAPRRFDVVTVDDDRAPYPMPADPFRRATEFRWSLASPHTNGLLIALGSGLGNALELDPEQFSPGDLIEVRVEIDDGEGRVLPCSPSDSTCSIEFNACFQRQSWFLEVR